MYLAGGEVRDAFQAGGLPPILRDRQSPQAELLPLRPLAGRRFTHHFTNRFTHHFTNHFANHFTNPGELRA